MMLNCTKPQLICDSKNIEFSEKIQDLVLNQNIINQKYFFKVEKSEVEEYELTYLGKIPISSIDTLKFLFSTSYSGLLSDSKKANSRLILYLNNKKIGVYYLGGFYETIPRIEDNNLIISNKSDNCNQSTKIAFDKGVPSKIFIICKKENGKDLGDLYNFNVDSEVDEMSLPIIKLP